MRSFGRSAVLVWVMGLAAFIVAPARADAIGPDWVGTYQSDLNPRMTGPAFLNFTMQEHRRFEFELSKSACRVASQNGDTTIRQLG